jgi:hypothetical protein
MRSEPFDLTSLQSRPVSNGSQPASERHWHNVSNANQNGVSQRLTPPRHRRSATPCFRLADTVFRLVEDGCFKKRL